MNTSARRVLSSAAGVAAAAALSTSVGPVGAQAVSTPTAKATTH
ncbi:hypothetical protein [Nocardioides sp. LHG3406-4]